MAAAAQLAAAELAAARLPGGRSPVTGLGKTLIDAIPAPGIDMVVATAETMDKPLLKGSLGGGLVGLGALAGVGIRSTRSGAAMLAGSALVAGAAGASRRESATASSLAAGAAGAAVGAAGFGFLRARPGARARLLVALGALAAGAAATAARAAQEKTFLARRAAVRLPRPADAAEPLPPGASFSIDGLTPLFTPPESFYVTDVQLPGPQIDPGAWRLRVGGMVERELELSLSDLLARDLIELDATLICVHNPVGGERVGSARWLGLPLAALLEEVGVEPDAEQLVARSVDGFTAGHPCGPHRRWITGAAGGRDERTAPSAREWLSRTSPCAGTVGRRCEHEVGDRARAHYLGRCARLLGSPRMATEANDRKARFAHRRAAQPGAVRH